MTWPLTARLTSHLPLGNLDNRTLPYFNLWMLEWNANRLQHGFVGYWNAPIFYPEPHAFALSEPQALTGIAFAIASSVLGPIAGYNLTLLCILVLNGFAARRLLRATDISALAAAAGGVLAIALPFALKELGVLQLTALFPALFALAELCALFRAPTRGALVRLALWFAIALWTCLYYALFLTVFFALAACFLLRRSLVNRQVVLGAATALLITVAAAAPIAIVQRAAVAPYHRTRETIRTGSALARDYATLAPRSLGARVLPLPTRHGRNLYPGAVLCALALTGLSLQWRGPWRRWLLFCASCALLAGLLSFGNRLQLFGVNPYELLLQRHWPGFSRLRSPYRFAAFAQLCLLPLAGFGLDHVLQATQRARGRAVATSLLVAIVALAWFEVVPLRQKLTRFPAAALNEPWIAWLQAHPGGAVAMVPPEAGGKARDFEPIVLAMLQGLHHGHALVNGYSGFFPARSVKLAGALRHFPNSGSVQALQRVGVRYVVCDRAFIATRPRFEASAQALHAVHADTYRIIYQLGVSDARAAP